MFGFIEIVVILAVAALAVAPIVVIIYLLYKIARKQEANPKISVPEQIERLAKLKDQGVLSETEFEEKKREYLEKDGVTIHDKERLFYYEIYRSAVGVPHPIDPKAKTCPHCNSNVIPASSSFCRTCGAYPI